MVNGKVKGGSFERDTAKKLSLKFTGGLDDYTIWRSASSGATSTILERKHKKSHMVSAHAGDLVRICEKGMYPEVDVFFNMFFVETKFYKVVSLYPPFNKELKEFFEQLLREQSSTGKHVFFVLKTNNRDTLLFTTANFLIEKHMRIYYKSMELNLYLFKDFLNDSRSLKDVISEIQTYHPGGNIRT